MTDDNFSFIDIHTHILPNVDDGSKDIEQTKRMLQMAFEQNTLTIIATPHFAIGAENAALDYLEFKLEQVRREALKIHEDFRLYLGHELYYSDGILEALKTGEALTLAGTRYVLVEFSPGKDYKSIYQAISTLLHGGYIPVIAHVERYICLKKREDLILELIELGAYIQMNCNSILGSRFSSHGAMCKKLLKHGLVHFMGSDCHSDGARSPQLLTASEKMYKICDPGYVRQLLRDNPQKLLENLYI